ncbi:FkbM family methyltransferase [Candidatus Magnetomorum sp. HK-1]|nr:FkbM family methyltransferase [Candidatus Magnetomorum sp. HK-1]
MLYRLVLAIIVTNILYIKFSKVIMHSTQKIKNFLFKHLSYKQINLLRKIKWMILTPFVNDKKEIKHFYTSELEIKIIEQIIPKFLKTSHLTVLDIGANIGAYSYYLSMFVEKYQGQCLGFEPRMETFQRLKKNVHYHNFVAERLAFSNSNGSLDLYLPTSHGCSSFVKRPEFDGLKTESVPVSKLDDYINKKNLNAIGFIKIDVEGHEIEVIEGAIQTISKFKPIILCESENRYISYSGKSTQMLIKLMKNLKYTAYVISKNNFTVLPVENISIPDEKSSYDEYFFNYWFFPENIEKALVEFIENYLKTKFRQE